MLGVLDLYVQKDREDEVTSGLCSLTLLNTVMIALERYCIGRNFDLFANKSKQCILF
ncbi:hypothetical protein DSUL_50396 [Desulfovibrionales bacterium]